jgi:hypothetical protein
MISLSIWFVTVRKHTKKEAAVSNTKTNKLIDELPAVQMLPLITAPTTHFVHFW